jgi:hypothetical protein
MAEKSTKGKELQGWARADPCCWICPAKKDLINNWRAGLLYSIQLCSVTSIPENRRKNFLGSTGSKYLFVIEWRLLEAFPCLRIMTSDYFHSLGILEKAHPFH